ncbi:MAG: DUF2318 domain-containing protein [Candidatus Aenigmarchaeota archaeon]|nr:DUF2318 domain-containing protein [Candidatus Aenigmarchaeota archaeon]
MEIEISKKLLIGIVVISLVLVGFFFFNGKMGKAALSDDEVVKIPLSDISEAAKFYEYDSIRYFVVLAKDGSIKTAFDACDVCYRSRKGYRQEGSDMICNNCGLSFRIDGLGTKNKNPGGCWPGYLPNKIENDNLVIKKSDLESGKFRFV